MDNPSRSQRSSCFVMDIASSFDFGHWYLLSNSFFVNSSNPFRSKCSTLSASLRLLQNRKIDSENGSRPSICEPPGHTLDSFPEIRRTADNGKVLYVTNVDQHWLSRAMITLKNSLSVSEVTLISVFLWWSLWLSLPQPVQGIMNDFHMPPGPFPYVYSRYLLHT